MIRVNIMAIFLSSFLVNIFLGFESKVLSLHFCLFRSLSSLLTTGAKMSAQNCTWVDSHSNICRAQSGQKSQNWHLWRQFFQRPNFTSTIISRSTLLNIARIQLNRKTVDFIRPPIEAVYFLCS